MFHAVTDWMDTLNQSQPPGDQRLTSRSGYLDMLPIALANALLVILTLNVYIFWAKTNVREYLWRTTVLDGKPLEYTGNGAVLARGFVITAVAFLLTCGYPGLVVINALNIDPDQLSLPDLGVLASIVVAAVVPVLISAVTLVLVVAPDIETTPASTGISAAALYLGVVLFIILSRYLTYRYLLRHTRWQGHAGSTAGTPWRYTWQMFLPEISTGFTLGWSAPWRFMRRFELLLDGAEFAGRTVSFNGVSRPIYGHFAITWIAIAVLIIVLNVISNRLDAESSAFALQLAALGVCFYLGVVAALAYYNARLFAHIAAAIRVDGVRLSFRASAWDLIILYFTNLAMNLLSVGLSYYYSRMRIARFITRHLEIHGNALALSESEAETKDTDLLAEGAEILIGGSYF